MNDGVFKTRVCWEENYRFKVSFGSSKIEDIEVDEPEPLGQGEHPNAGMLLATAVGNCLCASLLFCMQRSKITAEGLTAEVYTTLERNEKNRLRVKKIVVKMFPMVERDPRFQRCREIFEDFCIVTQSVREGIDVDVEVFPVHRGEDSGRGVEKGPSDHGRDQ